MTSAWGSALATCTLRGGSFETAPSGSTRAMRPCSFSVLTMKVGKAGEMHTGSRDSSSQTSGLLLAAPCRVGPARPLCPDPHRPHREGAQNTEAREAEATVSCLLFRSMFSKQKIHTHTTTTHTHTVHCLSQKDFIFRFSCIAFLCFRNFFFLTERRLQKTDKESTRGLCGDHFL